MIAGANEPGPQARRAPARRPDARRALRRLLRRPRRRAPARARRGRTTSAPSSRLAEYVERAPRRRRSTSRCRWPRSRASSRLLEELRDTTASIYFVPDIFVFDLIQARVDSSAGCRWWRCARRRSTASTALVKRVSDFVLAALILVLIAPLLLAIAVGVKLSSPGPVLFKQRRYGAGRHARSWSTSSAR